MELRLFLCFLFFRFQEIHGTGTIDVTGGGIVGLGTDIVLKYNTDEEWFMCTFFRYEPIEGDKNNAEKEYCSYVTQDGAVSEFRCEPDTLSDHFEYTGTSKNECTVTIKNVSMEDDVQWAARLATDLEALRFEIEVATPVESISTEIPTAFTQIVDYLILFC